MSITSGRSGILLPSVIFIYAVCHERPWISWAIEKKNHVFTTDENVSLSHYTKQKHWQGGIDYFNSPKRKRMWAIPDLGEKCPVKSLKLFLSKTASFKPTLSSPHYESIWFRNISVKQYQFSHFRGYLKNAQCSKTNRAPCLRATAIRRMNNASFEIRYIIHISDHKYESSVKSYNSDCSNRKIDERNFMWSYRSIQAQQFTGRYFSERDHFCSRLGSVQFNKCYTCSLINANVAFSVIWIYVKFNFQ